MRRLFIYYSLTGNGDVVAGTLKKQGCDLRKVTSSSYYPHHLFPLIAYGGYKALFHLQDHLIDFDTDISDYDEIIIGSPIWCDRLSCPINAVLRQLELKNKKVSFIFWSMSGGGSHAQKRVAKALQTDSIVLKEPKKNPEELTKIGQSR